MLGRGCWERGRGVREGILRRLWAGERKGYWGGIQGGRQEEEDKGKGKWDGGGMGSGRGWGVGGDGEWEGEKGKRRDDLTLQSECRESSAALLMS